MDQLIKILSDSLELTASQINEVERIFLLLLMLPIVSTIIGFFRYFIGIKSFNIYVPIALTFAFYELGFISNGTGSGDVNFSRGLQFGVMLYLIVLLTSICSYWFIRKLRMNYIPKSSLVLISVSLTLIASIIIGSIMFKKEGLINSNILFSIIIIGTLSDTFISYVARKKVKETLRQSIYTLLISIIAFGFISSTIVTSLIINHTLISIIVVIFVNILLGNFTGLRLTEYWRFRDILFEMTSTGNVSTNKKPEKK